MQKMLWVAVIVGILICNSNGYPSAERKAIPFSQFPIATNDHFTWNMHDGSYRFGMQGQDQWRIEKRYPNGKVYVRYSYRTPDGQIIDNSFTRGGPAEIDQRNEETLVANTNLSEDSEAVLDTKPPRPIEEGIPQQKENNEDFIEFPPLPRLAKPYGALAKASANIDNVDSKGVVDEEANAIVINLI